MPVNDRASVPRTVVTGGTRGIGAAVARRLALGGQEVVAWGHRPGAPPPAWVASMPAGALRSDGARCESLDELTAAFERANADGAGLTGLVVSAGIWEPSPIEGEPAARVAAFERVLDVNLMGTIRTVLAFLPHARRGVPASIVLVGSTAGQRGESGYAAYAASKAALMGLAKSWAVELGPRGVRVNVCAPGWVDTEMTAGALGDPAQRAAIERAIPRGKVASADDLAGPIAFLLGGDSLHVTGTVLSVNGGGVMASF